VVTTLLSPGSVAMIKGIPVEQVSGSLCQDQQPVRRHPVWCHRRRALQPLQQRGAAQGAGFFSGRRLVPIVTSVVMIVVSFILMAVWPVIYGGLVSFGESIVSMGSTAGIYAFFNRLLIPVGLHHALNSVFWFDVAGINDIPNFLGGQSSIDAGKAVVAW
jgi:PTS system N-acetylglucosamine-specific IIC component